jgi:hypothetical protein
MWRKWFQASLIGLIFLGSAISRKMSRPSNSDREGPRTIPHQKSDVAEQQLNSQKRYRFTPSELIEVATLSAAALYGIGSLFVYEMLFEFNVSPNDIGLQFPDLVGRIALAFSPALILAATLLTLPRYSFASRHPLWMIGFIVAVVPISTLAAVLVMLIERIEGPFNVFVNISGILVLTLTGVSLAEALRYIATRPLPLLYTGTYFACYLVALGVGTDIVRNLVHDRVFTEGGAVDDLTTNTYLPPIFEFQWAHLLDPVTGEYTGRCMIYVGSNDGVHVLLDRDTRYVHRVAVESTELRLEGPEVLPC